MLGWTLLPFTTEIPKPLASPVPPSPRLLDRHGEVLEDFARTDFFRHHPVQLEEVPPALRDATLAAEDKRFHRHDGVDYLAVLRAARDAIRYREVVSGASTITQQLVKISAAPAPRNLATKVREAFTAQHLEVRWTKDEILGAYFNRLDYGNHRQGCREAARFYFGKPLGDLSLAECALLAGLPQSPSRHDPLHNPDSALKRRNWILDRLANEFDYRPETIAAAKAEPLCLDTRRPASEAPHLAAALRTTIRDEDQADIQTTIDRELQQSVTTTVERELARLAPSNVRHAAVVVLENDSGEVLALVGSGDFEDLRGGQINGALVPRSAGSTLKPFTYLLAFEEYGLSPGSLVADIPTPYRTEEGLELPKNFDHKHHGPVTIRHALANSLNVAAMRTLNKCGGPTVLAGFLRQLGFQTLSRPAREYGLGLTIGNAEVTLLELTNAYATLARLGKRQPVVLVRPSSAGPPIAPDHASAAEPVAAAQSVYLLADILSDNTSRSAAFGSHSTLRLPFPAAVKTGTSSDFRDNWCVGFTADYTVGVWVGNFDNTPMRGISGVSGAGPIFHQVMLDLYRDRTPRWLDRPTNLVDIAIDSRTGNRFPDRASLGQAFAAPELSHANRLPPLVSPRDYDRLGRALLDARYTEWFESPDNTRHDDLALTSERPRDLTPEIISPLPTATYLLDPELPSGGRLLKLLSNLPANAQWSSPTLRIEGSTAFLEPGHHEIVLTDPDSGIATSQKIQVESL